MAIALLFAFMHTDASLPARTSIDDRDTVAAIRMGNDEAFARMFRAHYADLVGYAESFLGSHEDAEEIVCELFVRVHERRFEWDPHGSVRGYLFRAVRNRVTNFLRDRHRASARLDTFARDMDEMVSASSFPVDDLLMANEDAAARANALAKVMDELPARAREVVALRWRNGMSDEAIAEALDTTVAAVRMQASRALKVLRERLPGYLK